ncbi:hypothetical protein M409DRAFT_71448 [Zasmidium cellare ATCC 36951]|uniref:Heterokaryon incompatibility domain-containing protein n=1 Tax=Zasmidium cellare ATCC 36951 TaxID=1080233 RepID=A0A6A6BZ64_ZASCE|nr:uncharacterized protein M409DRAFT_71448 [Zasmidium cellare ATCC 36951]KAF2158819.1 hypothetical protein M409DRAFT_71448 [Zasmidium cellare ATCC 36951]
MRLINVHTLELKTFGHSDIPLYAALSHRWSGNEIEYGDFINPESRNGTGFEKIRNACRERNFTEYTEAINSMWNWYRRAAFCIVYLADVKHFEHRSDSLAALRQSEWFERGWTLQELLAPRTLFFYSNEWQQIGSSGESDLMDTIARASRIPSRYLGNRKKKITDVSVAQRMSWAAQRTTTRPEDLAYCLIGIFDVNTTTMYGEGFGKAFQRSQRMILDRCDDESIFAFTPRKGQDGVLATSPREFAGCGNIIKCTRDRDQI